MSNSESYNKDLFYEYGSNPDYKHLVELVQDNTSKGGFPDFRTYVFGRPNRWFPFRDIDDLLKKDMRVYSFPRTIPFLLLGISLLGQSIYHVKTYFPLGKYGYTSIKQIPFYKKYGIVGVIGSSLYVLSCAYFCYKTTKLSLQMFYERVIMQERNWLLEYYKFTNEHGNYYYSDSYTSNEKMIPEQSLKDINKNSLPEPKYFS